MTVVLITDSIARGLVNEIAFDPTLGIPCCMQFKSLEKKVFVFGAPLRGMLCGRKEMICWNLVPHHLSHLIRTSLLNHRGAKSRHLQLQISSIHRLINLFLAFSCLSKYHR